MQRKTDETLKHTDTHRQTRTTASIAAARPVSQCAQHLNTVRPLLLERERSLGLLMHLSSSPHLSPSISQPVPLCIWRVLVQTHQCDAVSADGVQVRPGEAGLTQRVPGQPQQPHTAQKKRGTWRVGTVALKVEQQRK